MTLHRNYMSLGKEVLRDGRHVADACDPETAKLIAEALNHAPTVLDVRVAPTFAGTPIHVDPDMPKDMFGLTYGQQFPIEDITGELSDPLRDMISNPAIVIDAKHHVQRQNDEYACKCGARWPVNEGEDHP